MKPEPHLVDALRELMVEETAAVSPPFEEVDPELRESFAAALVELTGVDLRRVDDLAQGAPPQVAAVPPGRGPGGAAQGHAYLRNHLRPLPQTRRYRGLPLGAGVAAAALVLLSLGAALRFGGNSAAPEPELVGGRDVYLGGEGPPAPATDLDVQTFPGHIDWSNVATETDMYEVLVKSEGERWLDETGIIYRSETTIDSAWTCPDSLELPPRFLIEVRALGPDSVSEPVWSQRYWLPPGESPPR